MDRNAYVLVRKPLVTEKNMHASETRNEFVFEVQKDANKIEIRKAIETLFNVKVVRVHTMIKKGLARRVGHTLTQRITGLKSQG